MKRQKEQMNESNRRMDEERTDEKGMISLLIVVLKKMLILNNEIRMLIFKGVDRNEWREKISVQP